MLAIYKQIYIYIYIYIYQHTYIKRKNILTSPSTHKTSISSPSSYSTTPTITVYYTKYRAQSIVSRNNFSFLQNNSASYKLFTAFNVTKVFRRPRDIFWGLVSIIYCRNLGKCSRIVRIFAIAAKIKTKNITDCTGMLVQYSTEEYSTVKNRTAE